MFGRISFIDEILLGFFWGFFGDSLGILLDARGGEKEGRLGGSGVAG